MTEEEYGANLKQQADTDMKRFHKLYGYTASYRNPLHPSPKQDLVVSAINNGAETIDDMHEIIGGSRKSIHNTITLLIDKEIIKRVSRGVYAPC